jgi:hypothetical protein
VSIARRSDGALSGTEPITQSHYGTRVRYV